MKRNGGEVFNDYSGNTIDNEDESNMYAHAEGCSTTAGWRSHAEGYLTYAVNTGHAEGRLTQATGKGSHAEGSDAFYKLVKPDGSNVLTTEATHIDNNVITVDADVTKELKIGDTITIAPTEDVTGFAATDSKRILDIQMNQENVTTGRVSDSAGIVHSNGVLYDDNYIGIELGDYISFSGDVSASRYCVTDVDTVDEMYDIIWFDGDYTPQYGEVVSVYRGDLTTTITLHATFRAENYYEGYNCTADGIIPAGARLQRTSASKAIGNASHAEGKDTQSIGDNSHSEGFQSISGGENAHAEGYATNAVGNHSHAEGQNTIANGGRTHAEGFNSKAYGWNSHVEGNKTVTGDSADETKGTNAHAEGFETIAYGNAAHSEGYRTRANGDYSHSEGNNTATYNISSHSEGKNSVAYGNASHAEGSDTVSGTVTENEDGTKTYSGTAAHAEGYRTQAIEECSHAEGHSTEARGKRSHSEGRGTIATDVCTEQHVQGRWNIIDVDGAYAHIVGNGTADTDRSNAHTLDWEGNAWFAGTLTAETGLVLVRGVNYGTQDELDSISDPVEGQFFIIIEE